MTIILAIAETATQAALAATRAPEAIIVALTPEADYWREREGRADPTIEELCDELAVAGRAHQNSSRIDALTARVAALSAPLFGSMDRHRDASLDGYFHFLRQHFDGLMLRAEQVRAALDRFSPQRVIVFTGAAWAMTGLSCLDKPPRGVSQLLLKRMAIGRGIQIEQIAGEPSHADDAPSEFVVSSLQVTDSVALPSLNGAPVAGTLVFSLFEDLGAAIADNWRAGGGTVIGLGDMPAPDNLAKRATEMAAQCAQLWPLVRDDAEIAALLQYDGLDLRPEMFAQLQPIICERLPAVWSDLQRYESWFAKNSAIVLLGGLTDTHYVLARAAHRAGAPVVSYHYGGFLGFSLLPIHERYDLAEADYFLCGGPLAAKTLGEQGPESVWPCGVRRARTVAIGLPWLADLAQRERARPAIERPIRRVMVVLNALLGDCRYLGRVFPPEIAYWRFTRRLLKRISREDLEIIVKPPLLSRYPQNPNPIEEWLAEQRFDNVSFLRNIPLAGVIDRVDAFILESPSTPLVQLSATRAPLALYVDRDVYRLVPDAQPMLARRCAAFGQTEEEFFTALDQWLAKVATGEATGGGEVDDEFLHQACIGEGTTTSVARIGDFLRSIAPQAPRRRTGS